MSSLLRIFAIQGRWRWIWLGICIIGLAAIWLLPIQGQILIIGGAEQPAVGVWPQIWADPPIVRPNEPITIYVRDNVPWAHVKLLIDGVEAARDGHYSAGGGPWTWRWQTQAPATAAYVATFYHSCQDGCIERGRVTFGNLAARQAPTPGLSPTKLGVVFADPNRMWHGRTGWTVELTYVQRQTDDADFSIDGLARRTQAAARAGLRVLVRLAYDRSQALPPAGDELALEQ